MGWPTRLYRNLYLKQLECIPTTNMVIIYSHDKLANCLAVTKINRSILK